MQSESSMLRVAWVQNAEKKMKKGSAGRNPTIKKPLVTRDVNEVMGVLFAPVVCASVGATKLFDVVEWVILRVDRVGWRHEEPVLAAPQKRVHGVAVVVQRCPCVPRTEDKLLLHPHTSVICCHRDICQGLIWKKREKGKKGKKGKREKREKGKKGKQTNERKKKKVPPLGPTVSVEAAVWFISKRATGVGRGLASASKKAPPAFPIT